MITQNGKTQDALSLLKVVELGRRQVKEGKVKNLATAFNELDRKIERFNERARAANDRLMRSF